MSLQFDKDFFSYKMLRHLLTHKATCFRTTGRLLHTGPKFSTIDKAEVQKFSDKAAEWWDPSGEFSMLQLFNTPRVSYIRDQLASTEEAKHGKPFEGKRMLDIGCGGGLLSEALVRLGGNVIGADASYDNIQMAKVHARQDPSLWQGPGKIEYRNTTAGKNSGKIKRKRVLIFCKKRSFWQIKKVLMLYWPWKSLNTLTNHLNSYVLVPI